MIALSGIATAGEDPFDPAKAIRAIVQGLNNFRKPLNDEVSRKWLRTFLARLDPNRLYFLNADFDEFRRFENQLDDLARQGDFQFPQLVRERYRQRLSEAVSVAEQFLNYEKHDYSVQEECPTRFEGHAADADELRERWRLHIKLALLIEKLHGRQPPDVRSQFVGRYRRIARQAHEMNDERLTTIYLNSLLASYDPHSEYLSPTILMSFESTIKFTTYSLGLGLRQRSGQFEVATIHPSLRDATTQQLVGWNLLAISRLDGETFDLVEMWPDDLDGLIRWAHGPLGTDTEVVLDLMNPVTQERITMSWIRIPSS